MKIVRVEIQNYRSHRHNVIDDIGSLVSFIGSNDAGKSNVFRALQMVLEHEPWPETHLFRDSATGKAEKDGYVAVTLQTELGRRTITRIRSGKSQSMSFRWEDGRTEEPKTIKGLGDDVAEFTGFRRIPLEQGKKPESLQIVALEDNGPFIIVGNTDATVMRKINSLASGAKIENAKGRIEKSLRAANRDLAVQTALRDQSQQSIEALADAQWDDLAESHGRTDREVLKVAYQINSLAYLVEDAREALRFDFTGFAERLETFGRAGAGALNLAKDACQLADTLTMHQARMRNAVYALRPLYARTDAIEAELVEVEKEIAEAKRAIVPECPECGRPL